MHAVMFSSSSTVVTFTLHKDDHRVPNTHLSVDTDPFPPFTSEDSVTDVVQHPIDSRARDTSMSGGPSRAQYHLSKDGQEEQFLLQVPSHLATRLHRVLEEDPSAAKDHEIELTWDKDGTHASLQVGKDKFRTRLYNLPTTVETWKSYDDVHLVKSGDVGQVAVVLDTKEEEIMEDEYPHGITKPMEHARKRHFRKAVDTPREVMERVELDVRKVLQGGVAQGVEIIDVEEEFIDGEWRPVADQGG